MKFFVTPRKIFLRKRVQPNPFMNRFHHTPRSLTILIALFVAILCCGVQANLLTNGSFEMQAYAGNGYIYSTDGGFNLPGWTVPNGGNQFFLEYGQPFGIPRYNPADGGRQAVCLNTDGAMLSMSQTFSTVAGQSYVLTFGFAEEQQSRPSPTSIRVDVAGVSQNYTLAGTVGYAFETLNFVATAANTTLAFTDTTTGAFIFNSPFIDSVVVTGPSAVPDNGSTLGMLLMGAIPVFGASLLRRRFQT